MDTVETKDNWVKTKFKDRLDSMVKNSNKDNWVWQMMVAASAMHECLTYDLDQLRTQNSELHACVDSIYAKQGSWVVGQKSKLTEELELNNVVTSKTANIWEDFTKDVGSMF